MSASGGHRSGKDGAGERASLPPGGQARRERLARALRDNLRKRREQTRARAVDRVGDEPSTRADDEDLEAGP